MDRKNIVELVRNQPTFGEDIKKFLQNPGVFGYELADTLETRLGKWDFYTRENWVLPCFLEPDQEEKEPSSDFVAIYQRGDGLVNLFNGGLKNLESVKKDAVIFSNILEEPTLSRWFHRSTGVPLGFIGTAISLLGAMFTILHWSSYDLNKDIPVDMFNLLIKGTAASIASSWIIGLPLAHLADRLRIRGVSESAREYDYACYALNNLRGELYRLKEEMEKEEIYQRLISGGLSLTKDAFLWIYARGTADKDRLFEIYRSLDDEAKRIKELKEVINPKTIDYIVGIFEEFRKN